MRFNIKISLPWFLIAIVLVLVLTGCGRSEPHVKTVSAASDGTRVENTDDAIERCYNGVVYVKFGYAQQGWGGAKFGKDGRVVTCEPMGVAK